jgi:hypothetical protein
LGRHGSWRPQSGATSTPSKPSSFTARPSTPSASRAGPRCTAPQTAAGSVRPPAPPRTPPEPYRPCVAGPFTPVPPVVITMAGVADVCRALIHARADVNKRTGRAQDTALHLAAARGHNELVRCVANPARGTACLCVLPFWRKSGQASPRSVAISTAGRPLRALWVQGPAESGGRLSYQGSERLDGAPRGGAPPTARRRPHLAPQWGRPEARDAQGLHLHRPQGGAGQVAAWPADRARRGRARRAGATDAGGGGGVGTVAAASFADGEGWGRRAGIRDER